MRYAFACARLRDLGLGLGWLGRHSTNHVLVSWALQSMCSLFTPCPQEEATLRNGNQTAMSCVKIIQECKKYEVPVSLENPRDSLLFFLPELLAECNNTHMNIVCDMCAFGTHWKKPTRLWCFGVGETQCLSLAKKCKSQRCGEGSAVCMYSGEAHVVLSGACKGEFRTRRAQEYPSAFAEHLAKAMLSGR